MKETITLARTEQEILACYPVMAELRPHIPQDDFVQVVTRLQRDAGFQMACLTDGDIKAVAGFRISEWLGGGRYLEIEDLATKSDARSKGYGGTLLDWLVEHARKHECHHLKLVSNTSRLDAHRFYLRKGMSLDAYYFSVKIP
ncbi:MAG TPA: GNAT family N-acetyltransferase [Thermoanaerobaculia bacterium]|nr:GNAT family N-acetyltransferase [Thermoanaerobaculia bacterium]